MAASDRNELKAKLGLQRHDLPADRRLLNAKRLRSASNAAFARYGFEIAEETKIHGISVSYANAHNHILDMSLLRA